MNSINVQVIPYTVIYSQQSICTAAYTRHTRRRCSTPARKNGFHKSHIIRRSGRDQKPFKFVRIEITYPGSGNNSQFTYDGAGNRVKIVEVRGGTLTSTKQFVFSENDICEERDVSGNVTKQFFAYGESITGSNYYFIIESPPGSNVVMTNSAGNPVAQYSFDPYGVKTTILETVPADFQFAGYYIHAPSGLNLTKYRAYNASLGRWMSRDPIGERVGVNLYSYVRNDPIAGVDPYGLAVSPAPAPAMKPKCPHETGCYGRCCEFYTIGAITSAQYRQCLKNCDGTFPGCPYPHDCSCACWWLFDMGAISDQEYRGCLARCRCEGDHD